jgi:hypothetical protein
MDNPPGVIHEPEAAEVVCEICFSAKSARLREFPHGRRSANRIGDRPLSLRDSTRFGADVITEHRLNNGRQGVEYAAHHVDVATQLAVLSAFHLRYQDLPSISVQPRRTKISQHIDDLVKLLVAEGESQSSDSSVQSPDLRNP